MLHKITRKFGWIALAFALVGCASVATPDAAAAGTSGCLTGTYVGYCGALTDQESPTALSFDVYRQGAVAGNKVIGYYNADGDKATDFIVLGESSSSVFIEYAPNGVASNLCVSEPYQGAGLVLRVCNGSDWQRYDETSVYPVYNPATGSKVIGYSDATLTGTDSYSATSAVQTPPTAGSPGAVLINKATGNVVTAGGLRVQLAGAVNPAPAGYYNAGEVFQHWLG